MSRSPTIPPIRNAQNQPYALRLLAGQSRPYSDAKMLHAIRLLILSGGAVLGVVAALAIPPLRVPVGILAGIVLLLVSVLGGSREKRKTREAATVQEELDVHLFGLPWNDIAVDRPTSTVIADAARRYDGSPMKNWYPDTKSVIRPLDVLICQRSNLGWGATLHRAWAAAMAGLLVSMSVVALLIGILGDLAFIDLLSAVVVPFVPLTRELIEMIRANLDSAQSKTSAENGVLRLWRLGMSDPDAVTIEDCRRIQDKILSFRQSNASIPDWFNQWRRNIQETTMQLSAQHLVEEAERNGATS